MELREQIFDGSASRAMVAGMSIPTFNYPCTQADLRHVFVAAMIEHCPHDFESQYHAAYCLNKSADVDPGDLAERGGKVSNHMRIVRDANAGAQRRYVIEGLATSGEWRQTARVVFDLEEPCKSQ